MIVLPDAKLIEPVLEIVRYELVDLRHERLVIDPRGPDDYVYMAPDPEPWLEECSFCLNTGRLVWYVADIFGIHRPELGLEPCSCTRGRSS